jgi:2-amino-4,5-dihydroxy-6-oxo-7-(phosphonooxy)heptanoate synthase
VVRDVARNGADAVILHKGRLRSIDHRWFGNISLIVHLNASTVHAEDPDAKYLVASVEEALRLGADAVSVHVNLGSSREAQQIADLAGVAETCDVWNMPLMAMMYPRGPRIDNPHDPELVAHAANLGVDLGADVIKTVYTGSVETMSEVVSTCPVPIVVAGGPKQDSTSALISYVEDVMRAGARGVAMGRNVFNAEDPSDIVRRVYEVIHGEKAFEEAREVVRARDSACMRQTCLKEPLRQQTQRKEPTVRRSAL